MNLNFVLDFDINNKTTITGIGNKVSLRFIFDDSDFKHYFFFSFQVRRNNIDEHVSDLVRNGLEKLDLIKTFRIHTCWTLPTEITLKAMALLKGQGYQGKI